MIKKILLFVLILMIPCNAMAVDFDDTEYPVVKGDPCNADFFNDRWGLSNTRLNDLEAAVDTTTVTIDTINGTTPINSSKSGKTVTISIDTVSGSQPGALSSTDWNTFDNKASTDTTSINNLIVNEDFTATNSTPTFYGLILTGSATAQAFTGTHYGDGSHLTGIAVSTSTIEVEDLGRVINGTTREEILTTVTFSGGVAYLTLDNEDSVGSPLSIFIEDNEYSFAVSSAVALTAGTDVSPQLNYSYMVLVGTTPILTNATTPKDKEDTDWVECARTLIGTVYTSSGTVYKHHETSDDLIRPIKHSNDRERLDTIWESGVDPTLTITTNGGSQDDVIFTCASGLVWQMHPHTFPAFAVSGTSPTIYVVNASTPNLAIDNISEILQTSDGSSIGNNRRFSYVIWGAVNESTQTCKLFMNLPSGTYGSNANAISDPDKYTNFSIPRNYRGVGFLIARLVFRYQTSGSGTWTSIQTEDLRGFEPSISAGSGSISTTEFADNVFKVFDNSDNTKIIALDAGTNITTGNTRTLSMADEDIDLSAFPPENIADGKLSISSMTLTGGATIQKNLTINGALDWSPDQTVRVDGGGKAQYSSIQAAIDSIGDASATKQYVVEVYPGTYTETVMGSNYIELRGMGSKGAGVIAGSSGTLYSFPQYKGNISNLTLDLDFDTTNAECINVPVSKIDRVEVRDCDFDVDTTTSGIVARMFDINGGSITIRGCNINYNVNADSGGNVGTHLIADVNGTTAFDFKGNDVNITLGDSDDNIFIVDNNSSNEAAENLIINNTYAIECSSNQYSGSVTVLSVKKGTENRFMFNHILSSSNGNGTFTAYSVSAGDTATIDDLANHIDIKGFAIQRLSNIGNEGTLELDGSVVHTDGALIENAGTGTLTGNYTDGDTGKKIYINDVDIGGSLAVTVDFTCVSATMTDVTATHYGDGSRLTGVAGTDSDYETHYFTIPGTLGIGDDQCPYMVFLSSGVIDLVEATVKTASSSGVIRFDIERSTTSHNGTYTHFNSIFSSSFTVCELDANEQTSRTCANRYTINTTYDDVDTWTALKCHIKKSGTGAKRVTIAVRSKLD